MQKLRGSEGDLTTVAKVSKETGISAGILRNALKEAAVKPETIKAGCSYYSKMEVDRVLKKLKKT